MIISNSTLSRLERSKGNDVHHILRECGINSNHDKVNVIVDISKRHLNKGTKKVVEEIVSSLDWKSLSVKDASNTIHKLAKMKICKSHIKRLLRELSKWRIENSQSISNILWACARMRIHGGDAL